MNEGTWMDWRREVSSGGILDVKVGADIEKPSEDMDMCGGVTDTSGAGEEDDA